MSDKFYSRLDQELAGIKDAGLWKVERPFSTPQGPIVRVGDGPELLNLCANNYLGLANDSEVVAAAEEANRRWGAGLASVRFICGTQDIHKQLEAETAAYFGYEDAILFAAAFDANGAVFEPLFGPDDAIGDPVLDFRSGAAAHHIGLDRALARLGSGRGHLVLIAIPTTGGERRDDQHQGDKRDGSHGRSTRRAGRCSLDPSRPKEGLEQSRRLIGQDAALDLGPPVTGRLLEKPRAVGHAATLGIVRMH